MRVRTCTVFGTFFVFAIAGCAAKQQASTDSNFWSWEQPSAATLGVGPNQQYGLSAKHGQAHALGKSSNEFQFSHPRVDNFVARFQTNLRGFFTAALSRSGRYVPKMSSILLKGGVPQELAYLPLIESGFRPHAVSRAGAVGPWQFIPGTGRRYGLRIDRYVDERRDPVKSTEAAAKYLKDLHDMFGDWHLSLAAYNTGEQNISRILERGHADDFWEMSDRGYLYQETSDFVPEFLAALQIASTPEAYGFDTPSEEPLRYDLVKVNRSLSLATVARLSGASAGTIKELNPALHRGVVPPQGYAVRVPKGSKATVEIALANLREEAPVVRRAVRAPGGRGKAIQRGRAVRRGKAVSGKHLVIAKASRTPQRNLHTLRAGRPASVARTPDRTVIAARHSKGHSKILD